MIFSLLLLELFVEITCIFGNLFKLWNHPWSLLRVKLTEVRKLIKAILFVTQIKVFLKLRLVILSLSLVLLLKTDIRTLNFTDCRLQTIMRLFDRALSLSNWFLNKLVIFYYYHLIELRSFDLSDLLNTIVLDVCVIICYFMHLVKRHLTVLVE